MVHFHWISVRVEIASRRHSLFDHSLVAARQIQDRVNRYSESPVASGGGQPRGSPTLPSEPPTYGGRLSSVLELRGRSANAQYEDNKLDDLTLRVEHAVKLGQSNHLAVALQCPQTFR